MKHSSLFRSAVCRVTWHNLDRSPRLAWSCWVYNSPGCVWSWIKPGMERCTVVHFGRGYSRFRTFWVKPADFCPGYTRLPGQETTVSATRLRCSFNIGTRAEWLIPAVDRPFTATIMSPHLEQQSSRSGLYTAVF